MRWMGMAAAACAAACTGTARGEVSAERLMHDVRILSDDAMAGRRIGSAGSAKARAYLFSRLRGLGLSPVEQPFVHRGKDGRVRGTNLLVTIPGTAAGDAVLVVGAHYDHLGTGRHGVFNGADDNASGVAGLLALAEALRARPLRHTVVLAFWDGEEPGYYGSQAFVDAPPLPLSRIRLNLNLDMISRSAAGELYAVGGRTTPALQPVLDALAARAPVRLRFGHEGPSSEKEDDWTGESDHASFGARGIPFVYFGVEDHPDYHRASDDADRIPVDFFRRSVETIVDATYAFDAVLDTLPRESR